MDEIGRLVERLSNLEWDMEEVEFIGKHILDNGEEIELGMDFLENAERIRKEIKTLDEELTRVMKTKLNLKGG